MRSKGTNDGMYVELLHTNYIRSEQTQNLHQKNHEHSVEVVSKIATFISIRLKHFAKEENERIKRNRLRKKLSKLVHFNNQ